MNKDQLRDKIVTRLRWTPDPAKAEAWNEAVEAALEVVAPLLAEAQAEIDRLKMFERLYFDVQKVLDEALGTEEEDGAGGGIAGDVWLLGEKQRKAEASRRDWAAEAARLSWIHEVVGQELLLHPRVCACVTDEQAAQISPRFSRPVCAVHPEGGEPQWITPAPECATQNHAHHAHTILSPDGPSVACPGQGLSGSVLPGEKP